MARKISKYVERMFVFFKSNSCTFSFRKNITELSKMLESWSTCLIKTTGHTVKTRVLIYTPKVCFKTHHGV